MSSSTDPLCFLSLWTFSSNSLKSSGCRESWGQQWGFPGIFYNLRVCTVCTVCTSFYWIAILFVQCPYYNRGNVCVRVCMCVQKGIQKMHQRVRGVEWELSCDGIGWQLWLSCVMGVMDGSVRTRHFSNTMLIKWFSVTVTGDRRAHLMRLQPTY